MNKQSLLNLVHSFNTPLFARAGEVDDAERQPWCRRVVYHLPPDEGALGNEGSKFDLRKLVSRPNAIPEHGERRPASEHQLKLASRSEEHTSELQSLMRISYAVFCFNNKTQTT